MHKIAQMHSQKQNLGQELAFRLWLERRHIHDHLLQVVFSI